MTRAGAVTRRDFLKAAAASVAAPYVITSSALGAGGNVPAAERITMGFIGVGTQGGGHLCGGAWTYLPGGYVARKDVQVVGVCDVQQSRRERALARVNGVYAERSGKAAHTSCRAYVDFRELLARADVDAVLIATPIYWHAIMAILAMEAGKDVYCEKPTACTVAEARAVADTARRYGRVYQGGTQQRSEYGGMYRLACELVRSGRIGKLKEVYAYIGGGGIRWSRHFGQGRPVPAGLDWDLYLGPAPWSPFTGRLNAHMFGTGGINWGQHHWDIVQWGVGADDTGPVRFRGAEATYADGVVAHGRAYGDPTIGLGTSVRFRGEGGVCFVGTDGKIAVDRQQILANPRDILRRPLRPDDVRLHRPQGHSDNFLECVRTRGQTICHAESSARAAAIMLLAQVSTEAGPFKWDPRTERVLDNPKAERLLSVSYRPPWRL